MGLVLQHLRGTAAAQASNNVQLANGQMGWETDTLRFKFGDGSTLWNDLPYVNGAPRQTATSGITASTTQAQGNGLLTTQINEVSSAVNPGDTVTLIAATAGETCTVMNNGASAIRVYPLPGENLGAGLNNKMTIDLAPGDMVTFLCYVDTAWLGAVHTMES